MRTQIIRFRFFILVFISTAASAQAPNLGDREFRSQEQRQRALEEELSAQAPDVRLSTDLQPSSDIYPSETPCFPIKSIRLQGADQLPQQQQAQKTIQQAVGHCLGTQGIDLLMNNLQNVWVKKGLITTRVLAPAQDLSSGELLLVVIPGNVSRIGLSEGSSVASLRTAVPARSGDLLNLHDFEQGLENLQRLPTVQANLDLKPSQQPGTSDVLIDRQQLKPWRISLQASNAGSEPTGKHLGGVTFFFDNPLGLNDLFYASASTDLHNGGNLGNQNYTLHYSVPYGYWLFGLTLNYYNYKQTVAGLNQNVEYSGKSHSQALNISRVIHRSANSKTTLLAGLRRRRTRNYIEDTEVEVQRRDTTQWLLGVQHRHSLDWGTFNASLTYLKGVRWFGAEPAPEEFTDTGTAKAGIVNLNASIEVPFTLGAQGMYWRTYLSGQWSNDHLTTIDKFSIGDRYTVRGFDGEVTLLADRGWFIQNELAWILPPCNCELFAGLDYGRVSGGDEELLIGNELAGAVLGLRGGWSGFGYEFFVGTPVHKPKGFPTDDVTYSFNLSWEY